MNIFDFVTQEELDDLPDDPNMAFTAFVRHAQRRLAEQTAKLSGDDRDSWEELQEARHGFMNVVVAASKRYQIEPFASLEMPRVGQFNADVHRQFKADLDHYMTQLLIDNSVRGKRETVFIDPKAKDRIRGHLHGLKTCVDNSNLPDSKKSILLKKLAEFEAELEKKRLNLLAVTMVTLDLLTLPGSIWASVEMVHKLTTNVLQVVGEAKAIEDETRRLAPIAPPVALSAPRKEAPSTAASSDLDDEIPF